MKKYLLMVLIFFTVFLFASCSGFVPIESDNTSYRFYYATTSTDTVLEYEVRTKEWTNYTTMLETYFEGPISNDFISPFPSGTRVLYTKYNTNSILVSLSSEYGNLSGVSLSLANAAITKTLCELPEIDTVILTIEGQTFSGNQYLTFRTSDFETEDCSVDAVELTLKLYYPDEDYRYLLSKTVTIDSSEPDMIPINLLSQYKNTYVYSVIGSFFPEGTEILDVSVYDGLCTITLNEYFYDNRPLNTEAQRTLLFSIVNSMTQLETITAVKFEIQNRNDVFYGDYDLSLHYSEYPEFNGPVRIGLNENDFNLYLLNAGQTKLVAIPRRIVWNANDSKIDVILTALLNCAEPTGLLNPLRQVGSVVSCTISNGNCTVQFNNDIPADNRELTEQSLVCTLCQLEEVDSVTILYSDSSSRENLVPNAEWIQ